MQDESKENTQPKELYITVEPTAKADKYLLGRLSNYFALLIFLFLDKFLHLAVPESIYFVFATAAAGLEINQLAKFLERKMTKNK